MKLASVPVCLHRFHSAQCFLRKIITLRAYGFCRINRDKFSIYDHPEAQGLIYRFIMLVVNFAIAITASVAAAIDVEKSSFSQILASFFLEVKQRKKSTHPSRFSSYLPLKSLGLGQNVNNLETAESKMCVLPALHCLGGAFSILYSFGLSYSFHYCGYSYCRYSYCLLL